MQDLGAAQRDAADPAPGPQAVVVGAGIAGLLSACALSGTFARVIVLERDPLPDEPLARPGVSQGRHVHLLLAGGLAAMERLLPGLGQELAAAGAPRLDAAADWHSRFAAGWLPRFDSGVVFRAVSRDLLEYVLRRRVAALANVAIATGRRVVGLEGGAAGKRQRAGRITGVRVRRHPAPAPVAGANDAPAHELVAADLVVDASGRRSGAPAWLRALGYASAPETVINAQLGYASRWFERPDLPPGGTLIMPCAPDRPYGGVVCPVENGRWVVTLTGTGGVYPPTDEAGFLAFAERAGAQGPARFIRAAHPLGPIAGYRRTENRWRHYERLRHWPEGLVVMGDALCAFNPVYGQGMSVSAFSALALARWARRGGRRARGAHRFQRRLKRIVAVPWLLATGEDLRWPGTVGPRPGGWLRWMHAYLDRVTALAAGDRYICRDFLRVLHLKAKPYILFRPRTAWRVLRRLVTRET